MSELKQPVRPFEDTFSAEKVVLEKFFGEEPEMETNKIEKIDAVIHMASIEKVSGGSVLCGTIEADSKRRFRDGTYVISSKVKGVYTNIVKTRNTVYYVASWKNRGE